VSQSLTASASFAQSFQNFIAQQGQLSASNISAYQNLSPAVGSQITVGEVLTSAQFFPAAPGAKYDAGRGSYQPTYFILNRAGTANASISQAALLPVIQSFLDTPQNPIIPHIAIGYNGSIIQMVDLANTAHYLQLGPQSPPNPMDLTPDGLIDGIIELTVSFEGGDNLYSAFNPNDNNNGIAFGIIQFNQIKGSLYNLCVAMNQSSSVEFNSIFGSLAPTLLNKSVITSRATNLSGYRLQFSAAGQYAPFQKVQRTLARQLYFDTAVPFAKTCSLTSQRAFAMLYDTNVQGGPKKLSKFLHQTRAYIASQNIAVGSSNYQISFLTQFANLADTLSGSNNRRHKLLTTTALSDGPLYETFPPSQSNVSVLDASCVHIVLEGRYGDPVTAAMNAALAQVINQCGSAEGGLNIPQTPTRVLPWTTWDHPKVPADPTLGGFPFADLFSQIQNPANSPAAFNSVFLPPQDVLAQPTNQAVNNILGAVANASTKGYKAVVLHAYDLAKAQSRSNFLCTADRGDFSSAAVTQTQNATATNNADGSNTITNSTATADSQIPAQTNVVGLLFDFIKGIWNDGKAL
jgi:hypothetical protein